MFDASADKAEEAHHFLLLMRVAELPREEGAVPARLQGDLAFRYAFSAFMGAARAVLSLLQEEGAGVPGFTRWYVTARERWARNEVAAFFGDRRQFRLVFPGAMVQVAVPGAEDPPLRVDPAPAVELPRVEADDELLGQVRFVDRPVEAVTDLCARYLHDLVSLVDQARRLAG